MKGPSAENEAWRKGFREAILLMCQNGLVYESEVTIQGVLAVTVDGADVIIVNLNDTISGQNNSRCMPTIADDIARKRMIMPLLSKLFDSQRDQANVLVSGLENQVETVGRLVFEKNGTSERPRAKLVIQPNLLRNESASTSSRSASMSSSVPAKQLQTFSNVIANDSNKPQEAHRHFSEISSTSSTVAPFISNEEPKAPMDLTVKKSLHNVIAKLHQTTSSSGQSQEKVDTLDKYVRSPPKSTKISFGTDTSSSKPESIKITSHVSSPKAISPDPKQLISVPKEQVIQATKQSEMLPSVKAKSDAPKGEKRKRSSEIPGLNESSLDSESSGPSSKKRARSSEKARTPTPSNVKRFTSRKDLDGSRNEQLNSPPTDSDSAKPTESESSANSVTPTQTPKQSSQAMEVDKPTHTSPAHVTKAVNSETLPEEISAKPELSKDTVASEIVSKNEFKPNPEASGEAVLKKPAPQTPQVSTKGFNIGMKLEAEDKLNALVCCATIVDIRAGKLRIHFDGWGEEYDFWCYPSSPIIHPVGWCEESEIALSPPRDWEDVSTFTWEEYLGKNKSIAVSEEAFKQAVIESRKVQRQRALARADTNASGRKYGNRKVLGSKLAANKQGATKRKGRSVKQTEDKEEEDTTPRKVKYCGKCEPCKLEADCGTCKMCLEKPKHGGHNTRRSKCLLRKCAVYSKIGASSESSSTK